MLQYVAAHSDCLFGTKKELLNTWVLCPQKQRCPLNFVELAPGRHQRSCRYIPKVYCLVGLPCLCGHKFSCFDWRNWCQLGTELLLKQQLAQWVQFFEVSLVWCVLTFSSSRCCWEAKAYWSSSPALTASMARRFFMAWKSVVTEIAARPLVHCVPDAETRKFCCLGRAAVGTDQPTLVSSQLFWESPLPRPIARPVGPSILHCPPGTTSRRLSTALIRDTIALLPLPHNCITHDIRWSPDLWTVRS